MIARWAKPLAFGVLVAVLAHLVTLTLIPNLIMSVAVKRIAGVSGGFNHFHHAPLTTPQNQTIVRPSPDLAYSTCALDVSKGPVRVFIGKGADYASAAFYASNTDNFFTVNDRDIGPNGASILVVSGHSPIAAGKGELSVNLPGDKGLLLVRRLAPSAEAYARVDKERAGDRCEAIRE